MTNKEYRERYKKYVKLQNVQKKKDYIMAID